MRSPSGAGKTSLIQAGLIPRLEQEDFKVLPVIRVSHQPMDLHLNGSGTRYVLSLLLSLEQNVPDAHRQSEAQLATPTLRDYLDQREADRALLGELCLVAVADRGAVDNGALSVEDTGGDQERLDECGLAATRWAHQHHIADGGRTVRGGGGSGHAPARSRR